MVGDASTETAGRLMKHAVAITSGVLLGSFLVHLIVHHADIVGGVIVVVVIVGGVIWAERREKKTDA